MEDFLSRSWIIKSINYNNQEQKYGGSLFLVNMISFEADHTCILPSIIGNVNFNDDYGEWELYQKNNKYYLRLFNCVESFYNDIFELQIINDSTVKELIIVSAKKKLKIRCLGIDMI